MEQTKQQSIFPLTPYESYTPWGGNFLSNLKNTGELKDNLGETWEVSTIAQKESLILGGPLSAFLKKSGLQERLPFLVKLINTKDRLSVQVHPSDEYALKYNSSKGKHECWYILHAEPGAGLYVGFKKRFNFNSFKTTLEKGDDISTFLHFEEVCAGDFFVIPPGTIHAIGAGVTLLEVQQSSDITFRLWDWNRLGLDGKKRQLHVKEALEVVSPKNSDTKSVQHAPRKGEVCFGHCDYSLRICQFSSGRSNEFRKKMKGIAAVVSLGGEVTLQNNSEEFLLRPYQSALILNEKENEIIIRGSEDSSFALVE